MKFIINARVLRLDGPLDIEHVNMENQLCALMLFWLRLNFIWLLKTSDLNCYCFGLWHAVWFYDLLLIPEPTVGFFLWHAFIIYSYSLPVLSFILYCSNSVGFNFKINICLI